MQNRHGVHLCPSEAEGFGHTLVEAMSCGAVVITTDGPPMNEMVTPDRGALVRYGRTGRQRLGTNYFVDVDALQKSIVSVMAMPEAEKRALCRRVGATVVPIQRRVLPTESRRAGRERAAEQRLRSLAAVSDAHAAALEVFI